MFKEWAKSFDNVELVSDGSTNNDVSTIVSLTPQPLTDVLQNRIGAVGAIQLAVKTFNIDDDLLIIGGDTLFLDDFSLASILSDFSDNYRQSADMSMVLCYKTDDAGASKCGILELDDKRKVTAFLEKPGPEATTSRFACPCFYMLSPSGCKLLGEFLKLKKDSPLVEKDAPGNFIRYLTEKVSSWRFTVLAI